MAGMLLNEQSSVADEYKKCYPEDNAHIKRIKLEEGVYRMEIVKQKRIGLYIEPEEFKNPETFMMRWGLAAHTDLKHLLQFLEAPGHLGNIYVRRHYQSSVSKFLVSSFHQTMRNTSIANQFYEFGHTYVAVSYTHLTLPTIYSV